jgi:hypothetical protein
MNPSEPLSGQPTAHSAGPQLSAPPAPPAMRTVADAQRALQWAILSAVHQRARCITCIAPRFDALWPFDDEDLLAALVPWLRQPQRRLDLLAADYAGMAQRFPRFEQWRRPWSHALAARQCMPDESLLLPAAAVFDDQRNSVVLFDAETGRGQASSDSRDRRALAQRVDAILQRSEAAWPVKTLGL